MSWYMTSVQTKVSRWLTAVMLVALLLLPLLSLGQANAVSKTWDGGCGLGDITWSCANNWSDDIVPIAGDIVTFDATSTNSSTVDSATFAGSIATININAGYTGTISLNSSLTVSSTFSQTGTSSIFTAGSQTLTMAAFTLSGGSFTASSGTTNISGALTISGTPTFNANGGTVNFNGTTTATLSCNSVTFNLVTFTHTSGTKSVSGNCTLPLGNNPNANSGGSIDLTGALSGTGTLFTSGTLILHSNATSKLLGFSGLSGVSLTVAGTWDFGLYTTFSLSGTFTLQSTAIFTAPSGTASFAGAFTINAGATFNANGGTVNFNATSGTRTLSCNNVVFNLVTFTNAINSTESVSSNCSLPLGNDPVLGSGGNVILNGTLSGTGTLSAPSGGVLTLNTGYALSGFSGFSFNSLTVNAVNADFSAATSFNVNGNFSLAAAAGMTLAPITSSFKLAFTINSGATFNANGGTVNFYGTTSVAISCGSKTFNLVTFTHSSGTKTVSSDCSLPLGNDPVLGSGGSVALNGTLSGTGILSAPVGGVLTLNTGYALSGFSGFSFNSLTVNAANADFSAASSFTVNGNFSLAAAAGMTLPPITSSFKLGFTINSGATFNANGGTVNFFGSTASLACGNKTFNLVTFTNTGTKTISADCNLPLGNDPVVTGGGNISLFGTLSGTGTLNTSNGTTILFLQNTSVLSGFSGLTTGQVTIRGNYDFSSYTTFSTATFVLDTGASFIAPSGTASIRGTFTINAGSTFDANGGTVNFYGTASVTLSCNNIVFNLVTFTHTAGTKTVSSNCSLPLGNDPFMASDGGTIILQGTLSGSGTLHHNVGSATVGQLQLNDGYVLSGFTGLITGRSLVSNLTGVADLSSLTTLILGANSPSGGAGGLSVQGGGTFIAPANMSVYGGFVVVAGSTFDPNGGTVILNGVDQTIAGDVTFYNLTKTVASADTLTFTAGSTQTVLGLLTLQGASGNLLSLVSDTPGTSWFIDAQGTTNVDYVDVADSSSIGLVIMACSSVDSGGNSGWNFNPIECNPPAAAAVVSSTSAITNFTLLQAALAAQNSQSQTTTSSPTFPGGNGLLPSRIQNFVQQFPQGKALAKAALQFLWFMLGLLVLGILFGLWLLWRRHKREEDTDEYPPVAPPFTPVVHGPPTGTNLPGTTIHPTTPRPPDDRIGYN